MDEQRVTGSLLLPLRRTIVGLAAEFPQIQADRKTILTALAAFITEKVEAMQPAKLMFICTHNSRRSHMARLWAEAAARYYGVDNIFCFSGGTQATAFDPRAVNALRNAGFDIRQTSVGDNPRYGVRFTDSGPALEAFSRELDHRDNPRRDFAAIMTCAAADENCPVVGGASLRIAIPYADPKEFDNTPDEESIYRERSRQIGREMLYTFSRVRT